MAVELRALFGRFTHYSYITRRSFRTTSMRMEKALENLKTNPYYEKYANRIAELQNTSPEEFMERVEQCDKAKKNETKKKFASVDTRLVFFFI